MVRFVSQMGRQFFVLVAGLVALSLVVFWIFKIRNIQRLRREVVQVEAKLAKGQELWRNSPPLTAKEKEELQKAQERLPRMLPKEKDVPSLLQEVSRVGREFSLFNLSLSTADRAASPTTGQPAATASGAPQPVVVQPAAQASPAAGGSQGPIDFFTVRVTFVAEYREIARFLEALQKIPQLMTIQSMQFQRGIPLIASEVVLNVYYLKGNLPLSVK